MWIYTLYAKSRYIIKEMSRVLTQVQPFFDLGDSEHDINIYETTAGEHVVWRKEVLNIW
ncbi:MAG: hypothetical protein ACFFA1_05200 [Promethearchaeota archaeon]